MSEKNEKLASRLVEILYRLNSGERLNIHQLADEFQVTLRTIQKDLNERLGFLDWEKEDAQHYKIKPSQLGHLDKTDIERFARFASIQQLFPKIDRTFYQQQLTQSIQVKGFQYENIEHRKTDFNNLQRAIEQHKVVEFYYVKAGDTEGTMRRLEPYKLLNKNGIWYLLGREKEKQKTFCFSQLKTLTIKQETFRPDMLFIREIEQSDSISHGNQLSEVIIQVSHNAAPYFLRRNLLPNQELIRKLDNGGLLLACKNINSMEIIPIVQYWIPHLVIISPNELQDRIIQNVKGYIGD